MRLHVKTAEDAAAFVGRLPEMDNVIADRFPKLFNMERNGHHGAVHISDDEALALIRALLNENIALVDDVEWLDTEREKEMLDDPWDE